MTLHHHQHHPRSPAHHQEPPHNNKPTECSKTSHELMCLTVCKWFKVKAAAAATAVAAASRVPAKKIAPPSLFLSP